MAESIQVQEEKIIINCSLYFYLVDVTDDWIRYISEAEGMKEPIDRSSIRSIFSIHNGNFGPKRLGTLIAKPKEASIEITYKISNSEAVEQLNKSDFLKEICSFLFKKYNSIENIRIQSEDYIQLNSFNDRLFPDTTTPSSTKQFTRTMIRERKYLFVGRGRFFMRFPVAPLVLDTVPQVGFTQQRMRDLPNPADNIENPETTAKCFNLEHAFQCFGVGCNHPPRSNSAN